MKKIFLLLMVLVLTACDNPFKKYEESIDILQANINAGQTVTTSISVIEDLIEQYGDSASIANLSTANLETLNTELDKIEAEVVSGNLNVLLASYNDYPEETSQVLSQIEDYKADIESQIDDLEDGGITAEEQAQIDQLETALTSAINIVEYLDSRINA